MVDDMLVAYGSAQLMIAKQSTPVPAMFKSTAMRIGQDSYIYAIMAVNLVVLVLFVLESVRTRCWSRVAVLDYSDPAALIVAARRFWTGEGGYSGSEMLLYQKDGRG